MFQLHVKDFQLSYAVGNDKEVRPYIRKAVGSVCFVNVYLMPKS